MEEKETNPYLALRAAKIARNEARLEKLGLLGPTPSNTLAVQGKRSKEEGKRSTRPAISNEPLVLRRSSRHSQRPASYTELPEPKQRKRTVEESGGKEGKRRATVSPESEFVVQTFPAHSARAMGIHVENLILGGMLGRTVERTGKAFVMEEAARLSGLDVKSISFNKYSGVQEWRNALFLLVNLGSKGDVVNDFLKSGRQITWFGGSRMHDETNVILRLIRVGKAVANGTSKSSDGLVLWCRSYEANKKGFAPYVCLGRLSYHSHEAGSRPLKFVWNLMDYDGLVNHNDEVVRRNFQVMVNTA